MIVIYTSSGSSSCRKAKQYMEDNHLEYIEKNISKKPLKEDEIRYLLKRSANGTDDIISKRSKAIQENDVNIEEMPLNQLIHFVIDNPTVLKRPIILDNKNLQIGYDADQMSLFSRNNTVLSFT